MIIEVKEDLIDEVIAFSWEFARHPETCSFPKSKDFEQLKQVFLRSIKSEDDRVLACIENEELIGVLNLQVKKEDLYLQSLGGVFAKQDFNGVATQFVKYLNVHYPNFEIYFGYPLENQTAIMFLEKIGAELLDACLTMELRQEDFKMSSPKHEVIRLPSEYYEDYAMFHDAHYPNIYWNSQRIFDHLDLWNIYVVIENQKIIGNIFIRMNGSEAEIFGLSIDESYQRDNLELDLLSTSMKDCFLKDIEHVLFFVNEDDQRQIDATLEIGFKQIDTYRCYRIKL